MRQLLILFLSIFVLYSCNKDEIQSSTTSSETALEKNAGLKKMEKLISLFNGKMEINTLDGQRGDDCGESNAGPNLLCNTFIFERDVVSISIPPYSCDVVNVSYDIEVCVNVDNGNTIYTISNFVDVADENASEDCWELSEGMSGNGPLPFPQNLQLGEAVEYQASLIIEERLVNEWANQANKGEILEVYYNRDACYKYVVVDTNRENYDYSPGLFLIEKEFCGHQCCVRETTYTIDSISGKPVAGPTTFTRVGECEVVLGDGGCTDSCGPSYFEK